MTTIIKLVKTGITAQGVYASPKPLKVLGCSDRCSPQFRCFHPGYTSAVPAIAAAAFCIKADFTLSNAKIFCVYTKIAADQAEQYSVKVGPSAAMLATQV